MTLAALLATACSAPEAPFSDETRQALGEICGVVEYVGSGAVTSREDGQGQVVWAEINAALGAAGDDRLDKLAEHMAEARRMIAPDDDHFPTSDEFDRFVAAMEGAERECSRFVDVMDLDGW